MSFKEGNAMSNNNTRRQAPPLSPKSPHDVFFEADNSGGIHLDPSFHAGHQFFHSLAELNRADFCRGRHAEGIATSIFNTIHNKGRGKVYAFDITKNEWYEVREGAEGKDLVFRALTTMFTDSKKTTDSTQEATLQEAKRPTGEPTGDMEADRPKKRIRFSLDSPPSTASAATREAASAFLQVQNASSRAEPTVSESNSILLPPSPINAAHSQHADTTAAGITKYRKSPCHDSDFISDCTGVASSDIQSNDLLCGGSGEGVLAQYQGNQSFLSLVDSKLADFCQANEKTKLRIAQQAVECFARPRPRFLAYKPSTGLWHELKREKAWFKSLRTFLSRRQLKLLTQVNEKHL